MSEWSRKYAPREEIQQYYADMAKYYGLPQVTVFNTSVISATWDEDKLHWKVLTENVKTGAKKMYIARVVSQLQPLSLTPVGCFCSWSILATEVRRYSWERDVQGRCLAYSLLAT